MNVKVNVFVYSVVGFVAALWLAACDVPIDIPAIPSGPAAGYYTVMFEADEGAPVPEAQSVAEGAKAAEPAPVKKTGFIFDGWYTDAEFTVQWDFENDTVTANCTLFAKWLPAYTVTFEADGGVPAPTPQNIPEGGSITQPDAMTQTGLGFGGWYVDDTFTVQWDFTIDTVDSSITLYAKWDTNYHTVTFNTGETGITVISPQDDIAFNCNVAQPSISNKPGYTLDGWYKDEDGLEQWDFDEDVVTEDITLHLKMTPIQYTVVFNANGAAGTMLSMPFTYDGAQDLTANTFTDSRQFYVFNDWNTQADGTGVSYTNGQNIHNLTTVQGEEITLYAQWSMNANLLQAYILNQSAGGTGAAHTNPTVVALSMELSEANWAVINNAIAGAGKFVSLDLTGSTPSTTAGGSGLNAEGVFNGATSYAGLNKITVLTMPDSVTEIAANSFSNGWDEPHASNLTAIYLPKVEIIGNDAFNSCSKLATISLPEATHIGNSAFAYCYALETVSLPNVITIGSNAFANCYSQTPSPRGLQAVYLPNVEVIGAYAFVISRRLAVVSIPNVTDIGMQAFYGCFPFGVVNTILFGASPPNVTPPQFDTTERTITVFIPLANNADYTPAWRNNFRYNVASTTINYEHPAPNP